MNWLLPLLAAVPVVNQAPPWYSQPAVHAALIGGSFALVVAAMTLYGVRLSLRKHSEREKENRKETMRKEAYFEMAGAVAGGLELITTAGNSQLTEKEWRQPLVEFMERSGKFYLVADLNHIALLHRFQIHYNKMLSDLIFKRSAMTNTKDELAGFDRAIGDFSKRLLDDLKPGTQEQTMAALRRLADTELQKRTAIVNRLKEQSASIYLLGSKYRGELQPFLDDMVVAIRPVLGFPVDETAYRKEMSDVRDAVTQLITGAVDRWKPKQ